MNVGDYVRNKYGIAKVIDIENNNGIDILVFDKPICFLVNKETGKIKDDKLLNRLAIIDDVDVSKIKSSPNIIDLIEVGDYVNGEKINEISESGKVLFYLDYDKIRSIENGSIKSIITKEQFESIKYKVGK